MYDVQLRDVPEQLVVTEQRNVDQEALEKWLPGAMSRMHDAAEKLGGVVGTADLPHLLRDHLANKAVFLVLYEGNPHEGAVPVECCAPVRAGQKTSDVPTRVIPAHREAYVRVTRDLVESGRLGSVYDAVEQWVGTQGLEVTGAPRETFWTDFFGAEATDEVFDVAWPVR